MLCQGHAHSLEILLGGFEAPASSRTAIVKPSTHEFPQNVAGGRECCGAALSAPLRRSNTQRRRPCPTGSPTGNSRDPPCSCTSRAAGGPTSCSTREPRSRVVTRKLRMVHALIAIPGFLSVFFLSFRDTLLSRNLSCQNNYFAAHPHPHSSQTQGENVGFDLNENIESR